MVYIFICLECHMVWLAVDKILYFSSQLTSLFSSITCCDCQLSFKIKCMINHEFQARNICSTELYHKFSSQVTSLSFVVLYAYIFWLCVLSFEINCLMNHKFQVRNICSTGLYHENAYTLKCNSSWVWSFMPFMSSALESWCYYHFPLQHILLIISSGSLNLWAILSY